MQCSNFCKIINVNDFMFEKCSRNDRKARSWLLSLLYYGILKADKDRLLGMLQREIVLYFSGIYREKYFEKLISQSSFLLMYVSNLYHGRQICYAIHFDWKIARFIGKRNPTRLDDEMRYNNISWRENWSLVMKWHKINKCSEHSFVCVSQFIHTIHSW